MLSSATDSTKEAFFCYDILCREEDDDDDNNKEKDKELSKDDKKELEEQILMNYMPLVKEYTEKKKKE